MFRVVHTLETLSPDAVAVELPPLAMPLFRAYASAPDTPPRLGGEMSAALQTAAGRTVGIDAPNGAAFRALARALRAERPPLDTVRGVLRDAASGLAHAAVCRLGAVVAAHTPFKPRLYEHIVYDVTVLDSPTEQAAHESEHVSHQRAFLRAIETPATIRLVDEAREAGMVERLRELRADGDVVAVVGVEHLDALAAGLDRSTP